MPRHAMISYVELPGTDLPATKSFYTSAFGWRFTDYGPTYTAFENSGVEGGFQGDASEGSTQPLIILYADDLEAMEADILANGGQIIRPIYAYPGGRRFHFRDPSSNELAVYSQA